MPTQLALTPAAEKFIRRVVRFSGLAEGAGLRLLVSAGGCSGYSSEFSAEALALPQEETLLVNGLRLFLPPKTRDLLDGVTIDFVETATQSGLSFINAKQQACGCSSADAAAKPAVTKIDINAIGGRRRASPFVAR
jgi:iron-sulfur cluster assembly accessory protein